MVTKNINRQHKESLSPLDRIALFLTSVVGTMWCFFAFCILALVSFPAAIGSGSAIIIVAWVAQTFIQLVLLPVILVGQNLQSHHSELRAENDYQVNLKAEKQIEEILHHLRTRM